MSWNGKNNKIPIIAMILLTGLFCVFALVHEKYNSHQAQERLEKHAQIIANDLWNFNFNGAVEYLKLAAESGHYESLAVISHNGELFHEISTKYPTKIETALIRMHLSQRVILVAQIHYNNNIIGWMEAVWIPETLYTHIYISVILMMILLVIFLYNRIAGEKSMLGQRVNERTNELSTANEILKVEIVNHALAENALRESEEKHRFLAENIDDVIWTLDHDAKYTYISPVASRMYGWNPLELIGLSVKKILTPQSFINLQKTLQRKPLQTQGLAEVPAHSTVLELEMVHKDGSTIWCEVTISFLTDETGQLTGTMGVARNITERLLALQEKETLKEKLERSKKMESLGLLAGGVAHDLNNVLSGIVSYPDLILLDMDADHPIRKRIETIRDSGMKAAEIVNDLLTLTRRGVFTTQVLNLNTLVQEYLASPEFNKMISYHPTIDTTLRLEKNLPDINGSPTPLKKVIMNLVSNAAEAQLDGGEIIVQTRSCHLDTAIIGYQTIDIGEYSVLSIIDKGEGISPDDLRSIFEPFYTKKVMGRSGTGLGLTVVWGTIEDHKGFIDIKSVKDHGTTIEVYIPISHEVVVPAIEPEEVKTHQGNHEKILVVDDIDYQREIACAILNRLNYSVTSVASGEEAIDYLETNSADLIILDMIMGNGMDGLETYRAIIEKCPWQKAIIASGYSETDRVKEAQNLGAGNYIKKPYKLEHLSIVVHNELART